MGVQAYNFSPALLKQFVKIIIGSAWVNKTRRSTIQFLKLNKEAVNF